MFGILSETMMTASRMDGFRYPNAKAHRAQSREPGTPRRAPRPDIRDATADQPL